MTDNAPQASQDSTSAGRTLVSRRAALRATAALGIGTVTFQRALASKAVAAGRVTAEMVADAAWIAGLELTDEEQESTARALSQRLLQFEALRAVPMPADVPPAVSFRTLAHDAPDAATASAIEVRPREHAAGTRPSSNEDLAFLPVTELAALLRTRQVTSTELTRLYLERLRRFDPLLRCVVTYTDDVALAAAGRADLEIAAGRYRGPLHGVPWGAKDLIAWPGYPTTWGAPHYAEQVLATKATVARKLEEAGAVLVAKLSLGALAQGDQWFRGRTNNPWNPKQGSSGSSAGSAAAVAAGLVGFAIGSETYGSITSPCARCGTTGLRPTFGRVSREGCMTLAWSMDKLGPIARSVEDCALLLGAIAGADGLDSSVVDRPFHWPAKADVRQLRVGYLSEGDPPDERVELRVLKELGVQLVPLERPSQLPIDALSLILTVESAAAFDELVRRGITEGLNSWPASFRQGEFIPAVEYVRANRARTLFMREMERVFDEVDICVGGVWSGPTNYTGHPVVAIPSGFEDRDGRAVPRGVTFTGRLFGESELLALALAYQETTDHHLRRPPIEEFLAAQEGEQAS